MNCRSFFAGPVAALLALSVWPGSVARAIAATPDAPGVPTVAVAATDFRLGTAARPFGWSTAIADFDGDGGADFAIADRLVRPAQLSQYRIQFRFSGARPQTIAFQSPHTALTIEVRDVDHDDDLDLIALPVMTRDVVRVWLNNGAGHFEEGDVDGLAPLPDPPGSVSVDRTTLLADAAVLSPERTLVGLEATAGSLSVPARPSDPTSSPRPRRYPALCSPSRAPRAPPLPAASHV